MNPIQIGHEYCIVLKVRMHLNNHVNQLEFFKDILQDDDDHEFTELTLAHRKRGRSRCLIVLIYKFTIKNCKYYFESTRPTIVRLLYDCCR